MRQTLHILGKDVRGLLGEIGVFLVVVLLWFAATAFGPEDKDTSVVEAMVVLGACYLTARVFHADNGAAEGAFWKTRPYRWPGLVAAKVLFLILFIHLPVVLTRAAVLGNAGFEISLHVPGLLWTQFLMFLCASLPAAAVAAMTPGLASFFPAAAGVLVTGGALVYAPATGWFFDRSGRGRWWEFDWVREITFLTGAAAIAFILLCIRYSRRRIVYRRIALGAGILVIAACRFAPFDFRWAVQSMFSARVLSADNLTFSLGAPNGIWAFQGHDLLLQWPPDSFRDVGVNMYVPLTVNGFAPPPGRDVGVTLLRLTLQFDGETILMPAPPFELRGWPEKIEASQGGVVLLLNFPDGSIYERVRNKGARLRGTVRITEFERETVSVPVSTFPANIRDFLRCSTEPQSATSGKPLMKCQTALGAQAYLANGLDWVGTPVPTSPVPVSFRLSPVSGHTVWHSKVTADENVEFTFRKPVAYARRDFEFDGVRLLEDSKTRLGGQIWRP